MPIYEFKCLTCNKFTEIIITSEKDNFEIKCIFCNSKNLERIISLSNSKVSKHNKKNNISKSNTETRSCSSGTCTTYKIPGPV